MEHRSQCSKPPQFPQVWGPPLNSMEHRSQCSKPPQFLKFGGPLSIEWSIEVNAPNHLNSSSLGAPSQFNGASKSMLQTTSIPQVWGPPLNSMEHRSQCSKPPQFLKFEGPLSIQWSIEVNAPNHLNSSSLGAPSQFNGASKSMLQTTSIPQVWGPPLNSMEHRSQCSKPPQFLKFGGPLSIEWSIEVNAPNHLNSPSLGAPSQLNGASKSMLQTTSIPQVWGPPLN